MTQFIIRVFVYLLSFVVCWFGMQAFDYERILKKGHTQQAQVLYFLIVIALAYLVGQFFLGLVYTAN